MGPRTAVLLLLGVVSIAATPQFSGATYTAQSRSTATVSAAADWTPPMVALRSPAAAVRDVVPLVADASDSRSTVRDVAIQYAGPNGGWVTMCTATTSPYTCSWDTRTVADGGHTLRAVATDTAGYVTPSSVVDVLVDNQGPTVTMQDPGTPLRGTVPFTATAGDAQSGVSRVTVQYAAAGSSTYANLCTATSQPWTCGYDTTRLPDGSYSFRAVATDGAGNTTASAAVVNRSVDNNTVSSVSLADPGTYLGGTLTLSASASSTAGVTSVRIQRSPAGSSTWTDVCLDTTSPYSCSWDTTKVTDGSYDLRAVLVDGNGRSTTSGTVLSRRVDNDPIRGLDVQTTSVGAAAGRPDAGDRITFTYSEEIVLSGVSAGWTGGSLAVTLRLRDGGLLATGDSGDTLDVLVDGVAVNLGSVNLMEDYIRAGRTALFAATITASRTIVGAAAATVVTLTVGAQTSGQPLQSVNAGSTMVWTPSSAVTDLGGRPASSAPVNETGALDREF